jgi:hypothetical protein
MLYTVTLFSPENTSDWDKFINRERHLFFFSRGYMNYHADRFEDFSLMIFDKKKLLALLPANREGGQIISHKGLTYGGMLLAKNLSWIVQKDIFGSILAFLSRENFEKVSLRVQPFFLSGNENMLTFCQHLGGQIEKLNTNVILQANNYEKRLAAYSERKRRNIRKANKVRFRIMREEALPEFWTVLTEVLRAKYGKKPVHNLQEILFLQKSFPENIRLYAVEVEEKISAGILIFDYFGDRARLHMQYIAGDDFAKENGLLDALCDILFTQYPEAIFSFGISDDENGLNENLLTWKLQFGGKTVVQPFISFDLKNYPAF